jgi:hypothetical protein
MKVKISDALREALCGREFYDLMQAYRHAPIVPLHESGERFRAVQSYVVGVVAQLERENEDRNG